MFRWRKVQEVSSASGDDSGLARRQLLRLGGMAAAGAAGATVVGVASAGSAGAADGDHMVLGRANDSGLKDTRVTANIYKSALNVTNTGIGPAVGANGHPVAAGGSIAAAGHGKALDVQGVATFSRSGVVDLAFDNFATVVVVPVPGGLKASSHVLAMAQNLDSGHGAGPVYPIAAEPNVLTGTVKIHLNDYVAGDEPLRIAWFVFG